MHATMMLSAILPLLAASTPLVNRAGGPVAKPIPSDCHVTNPLRASKPHHGYKPKLALVANNLIYSAHYTSGFSHSHDKKQCDEQCYGYGDLGECKSSFTAFHAPDPSTGTFGTVCLLFSEHLSPSDFELAPVKGNYVDASAADIYCPN